MRESSDGDAPAGDAGEDDRAIADSASEGNLLAAM